ncbi:hypothetical protein GOP47_0012287 [Adiantum capillus-veneris]|uniref:Uncharacterized protein n=1 Tax=Adiantum capillus-veneris TaxID=13818 RepID=A0A9D4UR43_ADICA|nr:hypothetical protein GOP47_0012287 [Adiantum capillus-veneris]
MARKQYNPPLHVLIRVENDPPLYYINAHAPSPPTPYYPAIFLTPSSYPAPSPAPLPAATSHSHLPKAAIIGGSVAGAVVSLAVTATVISAVAGKAGLSCILAPLLKILSSPFSAAFCSGPCAKLDTLFCNRLCRNRKENGSDKSTSGGPCAKLISLCGNLQWRNRKKDGSHDKPSNDPTEGDSDTKLYIDVLGGQYSPEAIADQRAKTTAQIYSDDERMSVQSFLSTQVSEFTERLEKQKAMIMQTLENSSQYGDQLAMSAQSFLTTQASDFAEAELKIKHKALIMQPLHENVMKAQEYFESLHSATSNASDELKALKSSASAYLDEVSKLTASAEHMGKAIAIDVGTEQIHTSSILATEYAAEMKRLQKLTNEPFILSEEVLLNRVQAKISPLGDGGVYHHEDVSDQHMHTNYTNVPTSAPIVETLSDANKVREEMGAMALDHSGTDQQYLSSVALVPTTSIADGQNTLQPEAGPIVPVSTKAITPVPMTTMAAATVKSKPRWQGTKAKRPANLGHVSCSCELSTLKLHFFTSCRSGGNYGSPPPLPSHAGDDFRYYQNHNFTEMHELDAERDNNKVGEVSSYYTCHPSINHGGNKHVGLLTSSSAPITHHYIANAQYHQPTTNRSPPQQMASPNTSTNAPNSHQMAPPNTSTVGSNSHAPSDYGNPFDAVL